LQGRRGKGDFFRTGNLGRKGRGLWQGRRKEGEKGWTYWVRKLGITREITEGGKGRGSRP